MTIVEQRDYANATLDGKTVTVQNVEKVSYADGIMDYVHVNSVDYTLDAKGNMDTVLVSMRNQSAVYEFDFRTGAVNWILGGKASNLTGYEEYTREKVDESGNTFELSEDGIWFCNQDRGGPSRHAGLERFYAS